MRALEMPRVSVVIPCFDHGRFIDEAVDSVLAQTYRDFEIVIVNDGSTDENTNRLLSSYQRPHTSVLQTPHRGLAGARNLGIAHASGEYILPLDADDRIGPTYCERAVALLDSNDALGIVYCEAEYLRRIGREVDSPPLCVPGHPDLAPHLRVGLLQAE